EEAHLPHRVVREDVAPLVVSGRDRDPAEAAAVLDVVEHRLEPLVLEIGREGEDRALHAPARIEAGPRLKRIDTEEAGMDDGQIHGTIEQLVAEEHELWQRESAGNASEADRRRLA